MYVDQFEVRLAKVRHRFASTLESKIKDVIFALHTMSGSGDTVVEEVAQSYRHLHGIAGVGPTVGFSATGEAARNAEDALIAAYRAQRGLNADELLSLKKAIEPLRNAVSSELHAMYKRGG